MSQLADARKIRVGQGRRPSTATPLGQLLNRLGWSITDLASLIGVSAATASASVNGHRKLSGLECARLSRELGLPMRFVRRL